MYMSLQGDLVLLLTRTCRRRHVWPRANENSDRYFLLLYFFYKGHKPGSIKAKNNNKKDNKIAGRTKIRLENRSCGLTEQTTIESGLTIH